jgi:hypothetical protein
MLYGGKKSLVYSESSSSLSEKGDRGKGYKGAIIIYEDETIITIEESHSNRKKWGIPTYLEILDENNQTLNPRRESRTKPHIFQLSRSDLKDGYRIKVRGKFRVYIDALVRFKTHK